MWCGNDKCGVEMTMWCGNDWMGCGNDKKSVIQPTRLNGGISGD